jgi:hypothetical protein
MGVIEPDAGTGRVGENDRFVFIGEKACARILRPNSLVGREVSRLLDAPLAQSGLINGVPLCAVDKRTRLGRQAIKRFAEENAEIAQFLSERGCSSGDDRALHMAVFYADGALIRPALQWRH